MMDAEPETVDPIMLDEKRIVVVRSSPRAFALSINVTGHKIMVVAVARLY